MPGKFAADDGCVPEHIDWSTEPPPGRTRCSSRELAAVETVAAAGHLSGPFWLAGRFNIDSTTWDPTPTGCPLVFRWASGQPARPGGQT